MGSFDKFSHIEATPPYPHQHIEALPRCGQGDGFVLHVTCYTLHVLYSSVWYDNRMIRRLSGTIVENSIGHIVLDVAGVGYLVHVSSETARQLSGKTSATVWTHLAVRETSMDLFGFSDEHELGLFELLISVSGIGPRSALAILSLASADLLRRAIAQSDLGYLTKVSGIGKKTAEKIILELKDKIGLSGDVGEELHGDSDVVEVLKSLGYSHNEARDAVKKISPDVSGTSDRIKEALKVLGGQK